MANVRRIEVCATLCAGNARKGNGWLLENATGAKTWDQNRNERCRVGCADGLPKMACPAPGESFPHSQREGRFEFRPSVCNGAAEAGNRAEAPASATRRCRRSLDFLAEEIVRRKDRYY